MKKVMFIKPAIETDAVFDPIRSTMHLGMWYLASLLKSKGYDVRYFDEVIRNKGLKKHAMFRRSISGKDIVDTAIDTSYLEFEKRKMADFNALSSSEFEAKYGSFNREGEINRLMVRTGNPLEETMAEIEKMKPDVIGIPLIASANYVPATELGREIKKRFPEIKIMLGGQHISADAENFLVENEWADYLIVGDAIGVVEDVVEGKYKEKIIRGGARHFKDFPILDPSLLDENGYDQEINHTHTTMGRKAVDYMFTKGCFKSCEFCVAGTQGGKIVTAADYDSTEEQLKTFKEHGITELIIQDDAFIYKPKTHLKRVLELMKKYGFYWQNNGGIDFELLTDEVTDMFIDYNKHGEGRITCLYIPFNPRLWNKGKSAAETMLEKHRKHAENLKRLRKDGGIYVLTSEIIGTPEHTREIIEHDIELHKEMIISGYIDGVVTLSATLLPGTKWNLEHGGMIVNKKDYAGYSLFTTHHSTDNIPDPKTLEELFIERSKRINEVQETYSWISPFPNATREDEEKDEHRRELFRESLIIPVRNEKQQEIHQENKSR